MILEWAKREAGLISPERIAKLEVALKKAEARLPKISSSSAVQSAQAAVAASAGAAASAANKAAAAGVAPLHPMIKAALGNAAVKGVSRTALSDEFAALESGLRSGKLQASAAATQAKLSGVIERARREEGVISPERIYKLEASSGATHSALHAPHAHLISVHC